MDDVIIAGSSDDILQGKSGNNGMTGSAGDDIFIWTSRDKNEKGTNRDVDTVTDSGTGNDKLHLSDLLIGETFKDTKNIQEYLS